jgi:D-alanyl-D-alanine carboxypeptidase
MLDMVRSLAATLLPLVLAVLLATGEASASTAKRSAPWRPVAAEIVMDARTGKVLRARNADVHTYPASLTKMMTLLLTFEALDRGRLKAGQRLRVSHRAASMSPSRLGLPAGSTITVSDAILALTTKSANDAAVVLAEAIGGSEPRFAALMTKRARQLGMKRTVFRNASGLPHRAQRTTARDMAILSRAIVRLPKRHYDHFSRRSFSWEGRRITSHNRLLGTYEGMDGIKTGFIAASGFNLAASAIRGDRRLIAVVLGGETAASRDERVADLLDTSFGRGPAAPRRTAPVVAVAGDVEAEEEEVGAKMEGDGAPGVPLPPRARLAAASAGGWGIQVGAFASDAAARAGLRAGRKALGSLVAGTEPQVMRSGQLFQARFVGVSEAKATEACAKLKARKRGCWAFRTE